MEMGIEQTIVESKNTMTSIMNGRGGYMKLMEEKR